MDLRRFIAVVWRFRLLMAFGLLLGVLLATVTMFRVVIDGTPKLVHRQDNTWLSASTLLVTQSGFPWGRAILDETIKGADEAAPGEIRQGRFADPARYSGLAALYSRLAVADEVRAEVQRGSGPGQHYDAEVVQEASSQTVLPMIYIKGYGPTPQAAEDVADRASLVFRRYLRNLQDKSGILPDKRVVVSVTQKAGTTVLFQKRSTVRPIMLFLLVMMAFLALAFTLENLRPRERRDEQRDVWEPHPAEDTGVRNMDSAAAG
jgi:hypothetical protein